MPLPIYALPDTGPDPSTTEQGQGWLDAAQAGLAVGALRRLSPGMGNEEQIASLRRITDNRRLYRLAARCYGVRLFGFLLPRETPMPVTLNITDLSGTDHQRRARIRRHVRDLLAWSALPGARRAANAYVRIGSSNETEIDDARTALTYFKTFKTSISERIGFEFEEHEVPAPAIRGLGALPLLAFLLALIPGSGSHQFLLAFAAITGGLLAAWVAVFKIWSYGYNQALWHCAESSTYDAKDRNRDAAVARAAAEQRLAEVKVRRMGFDLPRPAADEGYLYVVEFSTGTVKVGLTEEPQVRLATHRNKAAAFGVHITNYWISPAHINFRGNETRLINACAKVSRRSRNEYFHEVGYERARQFAYGLTYFSANTEQASVEGVWA